MAETLASIEKCHFTNLFSNFSKQVLLLRCRGCPTAQEKPAALTRHLRGAGGRGVRPPKASAQTDSFLPCPPSPLGTRTRLLNYFLPPTLASSHNTTWHQPATNNSLLVFRPPPHSPAVSARAYVLFGFLKRAILSPAKKKKKSMTLHPVWASAAITNTLHFQI